MAAMTKPVQVVEAPEILAPAGSPDCLPAAVAGGAHAVYLGLRHFNARGRAENFRLADLPRYVGYLHEHGLKCYVVLNTLLQDDEHPKALNFAAAAAAAGVDAAIIQDLGLWHLLQRYVPELPRHASTQMTIHHPSQVAVLADLGAERVIVARELALAELRECAVVAQGRGVEIEHFVHGALCYAFSGQCLMSNFAGCRSANRGTCAQNCRFVYDGGAGSPDTLISMRDLALVDQVGMLAEAGVASFKIEGRLKGPDYVYTVARAYSQALQAWQEGRSLAVAQRDEALRTVFARPFTDTPLAGDYSPAARLSLHQHDSHAADGALLHLDRAAGTALITAELAPRPGQGYAFSCSNYRGGLQVLQARVEGAGRWRCRIRIARRGPHVPSGTPLRRNSDPRRGQEAAAAMARVPLARAPVAGQGLQAVLEARRGELPQLTLSGLGVRVQVVGERPVVAASNRAVDQDTVAAALGTLAGSGYQLQDVQLAADEGVFVPAAQLKAMRRAAVAQLPSPQPPTVTMAPPLAAPARRRTTELWVVVGSLAAAEAALTAGAGQVWLDDPQLDLWGAQPPSLTVPASCAGRLWLRHPAVAAPSPHLPALGLPVVAGHLGVLAAAREAGLPVIADVFHNVCSHATLSALGPLGAEAVVISLECSAREVGKLVERCQDPQLPAVALVAHGRLPAMLTRQDHGLAIGQQQGIQASAREGGLAYHLQRCAGGWTAVWEARRLAAPQPVATTAGLVDSWVLECGDLEAAGVAAVTAAYGQLLAGTLEPEQLLQELAPYQGAGWFPGHLHTGSRALDAVQQRLQPITQGVDDEHEAS